MHLGLFPTAFARQILENSDAVPISVLPKSTKGKTMKDPEVARLRRLRVEALRVREIARVLGSARWASEDSLLSRSACASWRLARVVSGRLKAHPYLRYQKEAGIGSLVRHRLAAVYLGLTQADRVSGLKRFESELRSLEKQLDDTRALSWSSNFSDTLGRSQYEISSLLEDLGQVTGSSPASPERLPKRAPRSESLVGNLTAGVQEDWPYLAF